MNNLLSDAVLLFLVMDPVGGLPVWLSLLRGVEPRRQRWIVLREMAIALAVLLGFLFAGPLILRMFGLSQTSLSLAGGIILFLIALRMIFPRHEGVMGEEGLAGEPLVVPLAIPMIAGPSAMATIMLMGSRAPGQTWALVVALLGAGAASTVILLFAEHLQRFVGPRPLIAMERLMGMILTTLAVEMFCTGLRAFLKA